MCRWQGSYQQSLQSTTSLFRRSSLPSSNPLWGFSRSLLQSPYPGSDSEGPGEPRTVTSSAVVLDEGRSIDVHNANFSFTLSGSASEQSGVHMLLATTILKGSCNHAALCCFEELLFLQVFVVVRGCGSWTPLQMHDLVIVHYTLCFALSVVFGRMILV